MRASGGATKLAKDSDIEIRTYSIIYEAIDAVKAAMLGMLRPVFREVSMGRAEVRALFQIPKGIIAGCMVTDGKIARGNTVRVNARRRVDLGRRLKRCARVKDDVREVTAGFECGIALEGFNDVQVGDSIESFGSEEVSASL